MNYLGILLVATLIFLSLSIYYIFSNCNFSNVQYTLVKEDNKKILENPYRYGYEWTREPETGQILFR